MKLKTFDEFMNSISDDELDEISQDAIMTANENPESNFSTQLVTASFFMSTRLLRRYHEWLSEQFEQIP